MTPQPRKGSALGWFIFGGCALGVLALGMLASSVNERRSESEITRVQFMQPIGKWEADNAKWGASFPREYNSWESTKRMEEATRYGGSKPRDNIEHHPLLAINFAGFGFGKDYNAPRGHFFAVEDVTKTARVNDKTPASCWTCKSPDVPRLMAEKGVAEFYAGNFMKLKDEVKNPIGCADCHNNETMALQISRPALQNAFTRQGKDITKASHQDMRSLVCAQCHVTYYFKDKETNELIFPWDNGLKPENMEEYYKKVGFTDFVNAVSETPIIKTRHPDFEIAQSGIHAARGVSCADCHMPYKSEGGIKFTDHQIRSPLENVANSCQVCHRWSEKEIKERVFKIQDNHHEMLQRAETSVATLHLEVRDAMNAGATADELKDTREKLKAAQFYWDYVASNNGMGFHAPQELARVLSKSLDLSTQGRLMVNRIRAKYGKLDPMPLPDLSTKEKAQAWAKPFVDAQKAATKAKEAAAAKKS